MDKLNNTKKIFYCHIKKYFLDHYKRIRDKLESFNQNEIVQTTIYNLYCVINYNNIVKLMELCYNELIKN